MTEAEYEQWYGKIEQVKPISEKIKATKQLIENIKTGQLYFQDLIGTEERKFSKILLSEIRDHYLGEDCTAEEMQELHDTAISILERRLKKLRGKCQKFKATLAVRIG